MRPSSHSINKKRAKSILHARHHSRNVNKMRVRAAMESIKSWPDVTILFQCFAYSRHLASFITYCAQIAVMVGIYPLWETRMV